MKNFIKKITLILNLFILTIFVSFFVSANQDGISSDLGTENTKKIDIVDENEEKIIISIVNFGRSNPFAPYKELIKKEDGAIDLDDIPYPPAYEGELDEEYQMLVSSRVNGILYDPYAKSVAIVNILGQEYMVHKGDTVHGILVDDISKNHITLKGGSNTYTVAVGDVIEGNIQRDFDFKPGSEKRFAQTGYKLPDLETEELINNE